MNELLTELIAQNEMIIFLLTATAIMLGILVVISVGTVLTRGS